MNNCSYQLNFTSWQFFISFADNRFASMRENVFLFLRFLGGKVTVGKDAVFFMGLKQYSSIIIIAFTPTNLLTNLLLIRSVIVCGTECSGYNFGILFQFHKKYCIPYPLQLFLLKSLTLKTTSPIADAHQKLKLKLLRFWNWLHNVFGMGNLPEKIFSGKVFKL